MTFDRPLLFSLYEIFSIRDLEVMQVTQVMVNSMFNAQQGHFTG